MGVAYLCVSTALLRTVLHLPDGAELLGSCKSDDALVARLLVEHDAIPEDAVEVSASFRRDGDQVTFVAFDVVRQREPACSQCGRPSARELSGNRSAAT